MNQYINNEKSEREKKVREALAIGALGGHGEISDGAKKIMQDYIEGEYDLDEAERKIIELYIRRDDE